MNEEDFEYAGLDEPKKKLGGGRAAKQKGKRGERCIANFLTEETGLFFYRTPNSGAFSGNKNRRRLIKMSKGQADISLGDIVPPSDKLKNRIIIESKFYKSFPWKKFREKKQVPACLKDWTTEIMYDCESSLEIKNNKKHIGLLYIKINNAGEWICGNLGYFRDKIGIKLTRKLNFQKYKLEPFKSLKKVGYTKTWFFVEMEKFIKLNKDIIFEREEQ